ncbi:DnaD domain protein [Aneurinibacillus aneurinilyticus]|uniref:DnaD domain protein n=1 Tax=Aneurinibacillus aneurinilyticus TaxID=1391 RepID=UPI0023F473B8|nr:helix-turn-helix domain-containing protein [Aneurinibacillus aneurinilyticus]
MLKSNLKQILKSNNLSIRKVSKDINYRFESIRQLYNDEMDRYPRELLFKLCKYLNVTLDELLIIEDVKSKKLNSPHDENTKNIPRDNTLKEQLPSKVQEHIQVLSSISPYKLIEHYQNGGKVAPADQKIIEELLNKYQLIPEVVNVLLEFIMLTYNRKLPKEVIYKIAGHWKRLKIQSIEEAIQQAKKNFKEQKNNFKTKNNLRKNKRVEKIPSVIIEQIEQQKNTNNEKSKENKEHSQLSYEERLKIYNEKLVLLNKKKTDSMSL